MKILVVEDDADAATFVIKGLRDAGHSVDHALDGKAGQNMASAGGYDAYVIDRMMPEIDGLTMLEGLRDGGDETPALFLSALGEVDDRVAGHKV
ncbi:MAG: response regulator [Pseudomonadota bacterium]